MSEISAWSTTASSNNSASPDGWPEGMAPSGVNDSARENMAAIRTWYEDAEWREWGHTVTYGSGTTFTTASGDGDTTGVYTVGRRVRAVGSSTGTIYGRITASSHSTTTTVTVAWDSGSLSNESLAISVGLLPHSLQLNTLGDSQDASGSPTTITFSSIPSWVKQFTLAFDRFSTSGTSIPLVQLGDSGGLETSGYLGTGTASAGTSIANANYTTGFGLAGSSWSAASVMQGTIIFTLVDSSTNTWVCTGQFARSDAAATHWTGGRKALSAALDRVAVTTVGGTDTVDGDSVINIVY